MAFIRGTRGNDLVDGSSSIGDAEARNQPTKFLEIAVMIVCTGWVEMILFEAIEVMI